MGFFATELETILCAHRTHPNGSPWSILSRMNIHPQQIDRLKKAATDPLLVATMPDAGLQHLRSELELTPTEVARLMAGIEADVFLRMFLYHAYTPDDAMNTANSVFAAMFKDRLATGGCEDSPPELHDVHKTFAVIAGRGRRGRGIRRRVEAPEEELGDD